MVIHGSHHTAVMAYRAWDKQWEMTSPQEATMASVLANLVRLHKTLRVTPAIAANVTDRIWSLEELADRRSKVRCRGR